MTNETLCVHWREYGYAQGDTIVPLTERFSACAEPMHGGVRFVLRKHVGRDVPWVLRCVNEVLHLRINFVLKDENPLAWLPLGKFIKVTL